MGFSFVFHIIQFTLRNDDLSVRPSHQTNIQRLQHSQHEKIRENQHQLTFESCFLNHLHESTDQHKKNE
jgi:hypothetical protein